MSVSNARAESLAQAFGTADASAARHNRAIETMVQMSGAPSRMRSEQAHPPRRQRGQRATGLLGRLRRCRWRPGMRRLYPNAWYRASAHLRALQGRGGPAGVALVPAQDIGQHVGLVDRPPRRPGAPGPAGGPAPPGVAVTKILTSASGQMTVPMSRPSSTAPGRRAAEIALKVEQRRPHLRDRRRPPRRPRRPRWLFSAASSNCGGIERPRGAAGAATSSSGSPASSTACATAR